MAWYGGSGRGAILHSHCSHPRPVANGKTVTPAASLLGAPTYLSDKKGNYQSLMLTDSVLDLFVVVALRK